MFSGRCASCSSARSCAALGSGRGLEPSGSFGSMATSMGFSPKQGHRRCPLMHQNLWQSCHLKSLVWSEKFVAIASPRAHTSCKSLGISLAPQGCHAACERCHVDWTDKVRGADFCLMPKHVLPCCQASTTMPEVALDSRPGMMSTMDALHKSCLLSVLLLDRREKLEIEPIDAS